MNPKRIPSLFLCLIFASAMCGTAKAVTFSRFTMAKRVNALTREPIDTTNKYPETVNKIWASGYLNDAQTGDNVKAVWEVQDPESGQMYMVNETDIDADGTRYVSFSLTNTADSKFPTARYRVTMYLNDQPCAALYFTVGDPAPVKTAAPTTQDTAKQTAYMKYNDPKGRFSVELPGGWYPAETEEPTALYISQNKEHNPVATIAVTVHPYTPSNMYTNKDAMLDIRAKLVKEGKDMGANLEKDELSEGDTPAQNTWLLMFTYDGPNGKKVEDRKAIMCPGNKVYVMSFMTEEDTSDNFRDICEHAAQTFLMYE